MVNNHFQQNPHRSLISSCRHITDRLLVACGLWVQLVHIGRFLHRPLLPILRDRCVAPGGWIVYHTFMVGCEAFGRPRNPEHLLRVGELREVFAGWEVLMDEVRPCTDGRPLSWFAARRPLDWQPPAVSEVADQGEARGNAKPVAGAPGTKRKKPERRSKQQRQAEAAALPRRFAAFYQGVGLGFAEDWAAFECSLLAPHGGLCFRVCGGAAAAAATDRELLATFGELVLPVESAADAAGLRRLGWTGDGGRSWRFVASRAAIRAEPKLGALRDWVVKRQRTGQVRKEGLADMLPVVALLRSPTDAVVERVLDLCAAPAHLAPGVGTGRLLDCLWGGGDAATDPTPQAKRLLVSNDVELSRCWMILQEAGLPVGRRYDIHHLGYQPQRFDLFWTECLPLVSFRSLSALVLSTSKPEAFPIPPAKGGLESLGYDRVLLQVPCSADAKFRKNGAGSSACRDWEPRTGMRLHKRQLASLIRVIKHKHTPPQRDIQGQPWDWEGRYQNEWHGSIQTSSFFRGNSPFFLPFQLNKSKNTALTF